MQTVNELRPAIGQTVLVRFESVRVSCTILDAKSAYGRARFLVSPLGTSTANSQWVEMDRFSVAPTAAESIERNRKHVELVAKREEAMRFGDSGAIGEVESEIIAAGRAL
jgi:hypothetical protein